ncbi:ubiquitin-related domain-containing protein [Entophlyctis helioformis]|nr:ubiquitin-related domain-containing protein [Entophlyctis helioformis]
MSSQQQQPQVQQQPQTGQTAKTALLFKQEHPLERRVAEAQRILANFPDRIPIIVERSRSWSSQSLPTMEKKKFLCPGDISVGQFQSVIRKRLDLEPEKGLFLTVSGKFLPPSSSLLSQIYASHRDEDGFLYVVYATESVFGQ